MTTPQAQVWKPTPFSIERIQGKSPSTVIFRLCGPFTARDMYGSLTPDARQKMLAFQSTPEEEAPTLNVLDLTQVPYMDSVGLGMVVTHYVRCSHNGIKTVLAGSTPRLLELFRMTKVDGILSLSPTVDEAQSN
jgi:anti-anti-sigma factor